MAKLALVGDVHGNVEWAKSAIYRADDLGAERIIFLGDFGYNFSSYFINELAVASENTKLIIEWIDGNHENFDLLEKMSFDLGPRFLYHNRGTIQIIDGVKFMFLGGATSVDRQWRKRGKSWWPQEAITELDIVRAYEFGEADVILSHDAPYLPPMMNDDLAPFPKIDLQISALHREKYKVIYKNAKPKYVFHGHYHVDYTETYKEPWGDVVVRGLNCDGTYLSENMTVIDTEDM